MEGRTHTLSRLGIGDHASADQSGSCEALLRQVYEEPAGNRDTFQSARGGAFKALGRSGLLQQGQKFK